MNFSESSRDWRFTPKIRIANTGRAVNAANMGVGLSIVNGQGKCHIERCIDFLCE
jgi:hypothetical protein